ncbi:MAG: Flagellar biosynthesis/type secretory pathway protein-like protein [Actinomycetia bacterium]|nr:Flagellar biosynthesis/type secretory pathway protein-like protein [Actinomycetes bacterium]
MNWSSSPRARVLRAADVTREAVTKADLGTIRAPSARGLVVDKRLVDDALADGFRTGYEAGFQTGLAESQQAGAVMARQHLVQLEAVVAQLADAADELRVREGTAVAEIEVQLVRAAFRIAEQLLGHELTYTEQRGRSAILRALQFAPKDGLVTAYLNPDDAAALGDLDAIAPGRTLKVVAEPSLAAGDCIVDIGGCHIDACIGPALDRIREVLETTS